LLIFQIQTAQQLIFNQALTVRWMIIAALFSSKFLLFLSILVVNSEWRTLVACLIS